MIDGRRWQSAGELDGALDACQLLCNRQGQPLLAHGPTGSYTEDWRVIVPLTRGRAVLPGLTFTDSSEALLSGRAPPFRLLVRAVGWDGKPLPGIRHCLSDPFVVSKGAGGGAGRASNPRQGLLHISSCLRAPLQNTYSPPTPRTTHTHTHTCPPRPSYQVATSRVKGVKLEVPLLDDHVSKIECVGVETQKKLEDIRAASEAAGVPCPSVPLNRVTTGVCGQGGEVRAGQPLPTPCPAPPHTAAVGELRALVETAEGDPHLRETLAQLLCITDKRWDAARGHVLRAVPTDVRLRAFHQAGGVGGVGLVFRAGALNALDFEHPVGGCAWSVYVWCLSRYLLPPYPPPPPSSPTHTYSQACCSGA